MADKTKIEWTDSSWTPIRARNLKTGKTGWHCEHATTGCEFCYAEGMNKRLGTGLPFKPGHRKDIEIFLDEEMLALPLRWKKPRMIFVCSMTDLLADFVSDEMIDRVFAVMALSPQHTFQVLTKRASRMKLYVGDEGAPFRIARVIIDMLLADKTMKVGDDWPVKSLGDDIYMPDDITLHNWPLPNVWLGISAERQQEWNERKEHLAATPAAIRFASFEPLLGPIIEPRPLSDFIHWAIVGGESGPNARPMHPDWARDLRDQCAAAGVAFFFKQWGHWSPTHPDWPKAKPTAVGNNGAVYSVSDIAYPDGSRYGEAIRACADKAHLTGMYPLGKKAAGRLLDGVEYSEMPEATR